MGNVQSVRSEFGRFRYRAFGAFKRLIYGTQRLEIFNLSMGALNLATAHQKMVADYAEHYYTFVNDPEAFLIAELISRHMTGRKVLDLGCGPVHHIHMLFLRNARETVGLDVDQENLDFVSSCKENGRILKNQLYALRYMYFYILKQPLPINPEEVIRDRYDRIKTLRQGNLVERVKDYKNAFDSVMEIGSFGGLDSVEEFKRAVSNAHDYLRRGGTFLMVNWLQSRYRKNPYLFNGSVVSLIQASDYPAILRKARFKLVSLDETSRVSKPTRDLGYKSIVYAVAKK